MPAWHDKGRWERLVLGEDCPICRRGEPLNLLGELPGSYLTASGDSGIHGYCCLVAKRHVTELHDLSPEEAQAFMADVCLVSRAIQTLTGALKMNQEVHGNTLPHLHMHIVPRHPGDGVEAAGGLLGAVTGRAYGPGEFEAFRSQLLKALNL